MTGVCGHPILLWQAVGRGERRHAGCGVPKTKLDGGEETVSDGGYMAVFTNLKVLFAARRTTCVYAAKKQEMGHSRLVIVIFEKGAEEGEGSAHSILLHVPEKRRQR